MFHVYRRRFFYAFPLTEIIPVEFKLLKSDSLNYLKSSPSPSLSSSSSSFSSSPLLLPSPPPLLAVSKKGVYAGGGHTTAPTSLLPSFPSTLASPKSNLENEGGDWEEGGCQPRESEARECHWTVIYRQGRKGVDEVLVTIPGARCPLFHCLTAWGWG